MKSFIFAELKARDAVRNIAAALGIEIAYMDCAADVVNFTLPVVRVEVIYLGPDNAPYRTAITYDVADSVAGTEACLQSGRCRGVGTVTYTKPEVTHTVVDEAFTGRLADALWGVICPMIRDAYAERRDNVLSADSRVGGTA